MKFCPAHHNGLSSNQRQPSLLQLNCQHSQIILDPSHERLRNSKLPNAKRPRVHPAMDANGFTEQELPSHGPQPQTEVISISDDSESDSDSDSDLEDGLQVSCPRNSQSDYESHHWGARSELQIPRQYILPRRTDVQTGLINGFRLPKRFRSPAHQSDPKHRAYAKKRQRIQLDKENDDDNPEAAHRRVAEHHLHTHTVSGQHNDTLQDVLQAPSSSQLAPKARLFMDEDSDEDPWPLPDNRTALKTKPNNQNYLGGTRRGNADAWRVGLGGSTSQASGSLSRKGNAYEGSEDDVEMLGLSNEPAHSFGLRTSIEPSQSVTCIPEYPVLSDHVSSNRIAASPPCTVASNNPSANPRQMVNYLARRMRESNTEEEYTRATNSATLQPRKPLLNPTMPKRPPLKTSLLTASRSKYSNSPRGFPASQLVNEISSLGSSDAEKGGADNKSDDKEPKVNARRKTEAFKAGKDATGEGEVPSKKPDTTIASNQQIDDGFKLKESSTRRNKTSNAGLIRAALRKQTHKKSAGHEQACDRSNKPNKIVSKPIQDKVEQESAWKRAMSALDKMKKSPQRELRRPDLVGHGKYSGDSSPTVGADEHQSSSDDESEIEDEDPLKQLEEEKKKRAEAKKKVIRGKKSLARIKARKAEPEANIEVAEMRAKGIPGKQTGKKPGPKKGKRTQVAHLKSDEFIRECDDEEYAEAFNEAVDGEDAPHSIGQSLENLDTQMERSAGEHIEAVEQLEPETEDDLGYLFNDQPLTEHNGRSLAQGSDTSAGEERDGGRKGFTNEIDTVFREPRIEDANRSGEDGRQCIRGPAERISSDLPTISASAAEDFPERRDDSCLEVRKAPTANAREAAKRNASRRKEALTSGRLKKPPQSLNKVLGTERTSLKKPKNANSPRDKPGRLVGRSKTSALMPAQKPKFRESSNGQRSAEQVSTEDELSAPKTTKNGIKVTEGAPRRPATVLNDPQSMDYGPLVDKTPTTPLSLLTEDDKQLHYWKKKGLKWSEIRILYAALTGKKFTTAGLQGRLKRVLQRWPELEKEKVKDPKELMGLAALVAEREAEKETGREADGQETQQLPQLGGKSWDPNHFEQYMANQQALADFLTDGEESGGEHENSDDDSGEHGTTVTRTVIEPEPLDENEVWYQYHINRKYWWPECPEEEAEEVRIGPSAYNTLVEANAAAGKEIQLPRFGLPGASMDCNSFSCVKDEDGMMHYRAESASGTVLVYVTRSLRSPLSPDSLASRPTVTPVNSAWLAKRQWIARSKEIHTLTVESNIPGHPPDHGDDHIDELFEPPEMPVERVTYKHERNHRIIGAYTVADMANREAGQALLEMCAPKGCRIEEIQEKVAMQKGIFEKLDELEAEGGLFMGTLTRLERMEGKAPPEAEVWVEECVLHGPRNV
ncbi:hypothetical protein B0J12DRAFT_782027 [Macrophomina phaseolina]|uniref:Uncharacterized protein n=1 Tax=Macrophomina phaseolina TaxID=35725 RepID=A0ABQ8GQV6_9PEZI|nr:hypothetical protein B0J12DRAFT_782027 [Macrophomina phaseolina]